MAIGAAHVAFMSASAEISKRTRVTPGAAVLVGQRLQVPATVLRGHVRVTIDANEVWMHWRVKGLQRMALRTILGVYRDGEKQEDKPGHAGSAAE